MPVRVAPAFSRRVSPRRYSSDRALSFLDDDKDDRKVQQCAVRVDDDDECCSACFAGCLAVDER